MTLNWLTRLRLQTILPISIRLSEELADQNGQDRAETRSRCI